MKSKFRLILIIPVVFLFFIGEKTIAQSITKKRSVTGMGGISGNFKHYGKSCYLKQSIGQSGIIGTSGVDKKVLIQGFLYPDFLRFHVNPDGLDVEIKMNPTSDIYFISVKNFGLKQLDVNIYNLVGQKVFSEVLINTNEFEINLGSYIPGLYILNIQSYSQSFSGKLMKK